jgi:SNF2 family DNA or RNA helicase
MSEKAIRDRMDAERKSIHEKTLNAPWREHAYDHQIFGAERLAVAKRAILGDQTGLGKTATSIIYMDMVEAKKIIVVAPKDVLKNFEREIKRWAPHRTTQVVQGMSKIVRDQFFRMMATVDEFVLLVNYEAWRKDENYVDAFINMQVDTVICDEAHIMREVDTKSFLGVKKLVYAANKCSACGSFPEVVVANPLSGKRTMRCSVCFKEPENFNDFCSVQNVLTITATSFVNKPQDMFSQLHLLDNVNFGSLTKYLGDYCRQTADGKWTFNYGGEKRLIAQMGTRIVKRNTESAGVTMPEQVMIRHHLEFEGNIYQEQRQAMEQIRNMSLDLMSGDTELNIAAVIAMYTRLRQAVTWPAGIKVRDPETKAVLYQCTVEESIIMDKAEELGVQAIAEGDRVVMFSQFKEVLKEMEDRLTRQGISCIRMDGDTPSNVRDMIAVDFDSKSAEANPEMLKPFDVDNNRGGYTWQVVLCHFKVGGVGLNLDLARQMVMIDLPWNPATRNQAMARIRRLNSKHNTVVHTINVENTITGWLENIIDHKEQMIGGVEEDINVAESLMAALRDGSIM